MSIINVKPIKRYTNFENVSDFDACLKDILSANLWKLTKEDKVRGRAYDMYVFYYKNIITNDLLIAQKNPVTSTIEIWKNYENYFNNR